MIDQPLAFVGEKAAIALPTGLAILDFRALAIGVLEFDIVMEHLASPVETGPICGSAPCGKSGRAFFQPLQHPLAHEIKIGAFPETRSPARIRCARKSGAFHAIQPGQRRFYG